MNLPTGRPARGGVLAAAILLGSLLSSPGGMGAAAPQGEASPGSIHLGWTRGGEGWAVLSVGSWRRLLYREASGRIWRRVHLSAFTQPHGPVASGLACAPAGGCLLAWVAQEPPGALHAVRLGPGDRLQAVPLGRAVARAVRSLGAATAVWVAVAAPGWGAVLVTGPPRLGLMSKVLVVSNRRGSGWRAISARDVPRGRGPNVLSFGYPTGMAIDRGGRVWIAEDDHGQPGLPIYRLAVFPSAVRRLPVALTVPSQDHTYVNALPPIFPTNGEVVLPLLRMAPGASQGQLLLYLSRDGGSRWQLEGGMAGFGAQPANAIYAVTGRGTVWAFGPVPSESG